MDPKELATLIASSIAEAQKPVLDAISGLSEAAKPKEKDEKTLSYSEIDAKLTEAKIPAALRGKIFESVAAGGDLDKAVDEAKVLVEAIREDVKATVVAEGHVQDDGDGTTDLRESGRNAAKEASALIQWG